MRPMNALIAGLFTALALVAGFVATAVVAAAVMLFLFVRRLFRPRHEIRPSVQGVRRKSPSNDSDVIDISATEVPARGNKSSEADSHFAPRFTS